MNTQKWKLPCEGACKKILSVRRQAPEHALAPSKLRGWGVTEQRQRRAVDATAHRPAMWVLHWDDLEAVRLKLLYEPMLSGLHHEGMLVHGHEVHADPDA